MRINYLPNAVFKDVLEKLDRLGIVRDNAGSVLFVLFALYEKDIEILDIFDNDSQEKRAILLYKDLELKGLIESKETSIHFDLTAIGNNLVEWIKDEVAKFQIPVSSDTFMNSFREEILIDWIDEYLDLWPSKSAQGYFLKGDKKGITRKMQKFIEIYQYPKEVIFEATNDYLNERAEAGFEFTKKVSNFIFHTELAVGRSTTSDLAARCEHVMDGKKETRQVVTSTFNTFI